MKKKLSPAQQQYADLKKQHEDCLLFFRLWDFYEVFYDDAHICHKVLSITLTARNKNAPNPIPMAWIPYHALEKYVPKLIENWYKIALAEQVWLPEKGKIVERKVTQIITPATYVWSKYQENVVVWLSTTTSWKNVLYHVARWDLTLWIYKTFTVNTVTRLISYLQWLSPNEIILDRSFVDRKWLLNDDKFSFDVPLTYFDVPYDCDSYLTEHLCVWTLTWYWDALVWWRWAAFCLLVMYFVHTQKKQMWAIHSLSYASADNQVMFDDITKKNLEIFSSSYEWSRKYSLYWVLDTSKTPQGRRLFKRRLGSPTSDMSVLSSRLDAIEYFTNHEMSSKNVLEELKDIWDLSRMLYLILYKKQSALRVQNFAQQLISLCSNVDVMASVLRHNTVSKEWIRHITDLVSYLSMMLSMEVISDQEWYICSWVDVHLDELRSIAYNSDDLLLTYQQELVENSWVKNIKIKYIKNQWYSLEVTPKDTQQFEQCIDPNNPKKDFVRTQSLKWWQRFSSTYLVELQSAIFNARVSLNDYEEEVLRWVVKEIQKQSLFIYEYIDAIAFLDVVVSFSDLAQKKSYVRPSYSDTSEIQILDWRHPVVEHFLDKNTDFIPNDVVFDWLDVCHLITWPNMWGKSTYLRQNAIILLMAHVWLYVPATSAHVTILDGIFARVWSWDALAKNQSTFMTEMLEMSYILHNATNKSFVVLDELWRWTSTQDWLSLAKAIIVYMCRALKSKVLFATHYHELLSLGDTLTWCSNRSLQVFEKWDELVFMKKIIPWWVDKSYGLDVAQLAWIPFDVLQLAREYLLALHESRNGVSNGVRQIWLWSDQSQIDTTWWEEGVSLFLKRFVDLDISNMSPIEVMNWVDSFQREIGNDVS